jgi:ribose transport system substrate-binding protein
MKKTLSLVCVVMMVLVLSLSGCQKSTTPPTASPTQAPKSDLICIAVPAADHGWVAAVAYYAEKTAKDLGLNYKLVQSKDPNEQTSQIEELIAMKPAAIILFPHNNELKVAAQKVVDAGIPLFNFDRKVDVASTCYLAGDNPGLGTSGADYIGTKLNGKGNVVIMGVPAYGSVNTERIDAFKKELAAKYPDMKILNEYGSPTSSKEDGLKTMTDVLTANKQIDAVYSMDDELSIGIYQAIKEANRTDIKAITGGGGAQAYFTLIKNTPSVNLCSILYSPNMMADVVKLAADLVKNGKTPEKQIIKPATVVDVANVDQYIDPKSPY